MAARSWIGVGVAVWGAVVAVPTVGLFAELGPLWAVVGAWAIVYCFVVPSVVRTFWQALSVLVAAVVGSQMREPSIYGLLVVLPAMLFMVLWMAPIGVITRFLRDGQKSPSGVSNV